ncbi:hypothetical protein BB934_39420 (plasmid) [Microvirga ossetica]|uniref:DUF1579 domain-containing protein n=1 Tax=Microvirga ossetica TaxID=1882682 RepID=A0A1B2EWG1_9HYPH|nr:hypothetical protein [Microvirga ossetica]ANY84294.1 hypothetical protein BB934_39420 [Microvirga ossetica]
MTTASSSLKSIAILSCAIISLTCSSAQASEADFLERFRGTWPGSGKVQREGGSQPRQVTCSVTGSLTENRISAQGQCRAVVIFSRQIGVDLVYDPRSGIYRGTYTGSRIGPARLTGTRNGDVVNLRIEWPHPVNGDTQATMAIQNGGRGTLRITVADNLTPGGPIQQTSEIILARR